MYHAYHRFDDESRTPAECYVYRKPDAKVPALQRSAMCRETIYRTYRADAPSQIAAIDMLLLWNNSIPFGRGMVSRLRSIQPI